MKRKSIIQSLAYVFFTFVLVFFLAQCSKKSESENKKSNGLILATASTGGTFYPVGVAIATNTSLNLRKKKITMNAITSAGSGENIQLLKNAEADMAILQALLGSMAWQGKGKYKTTQKHLRSVTMLWKNVEHMVITTDYVKSGTVEDLKGMNKKSFSIGKLGSGTETSGRTILSALGIQLDDFFKLVHQGYTPSTNSLKNGRIEGMNIPAGVPVSAITQAFASIGDENIRVLDFTDAQLNMVNKEFPVWTRYNIPAGTYPGQKREIKTIAQPNFLSVRADLSEETVYLIVKNIYENLEFLNNMHPATKVMNLQQAIAGLPVPLHPGAYKFYKEKGISIPAFLNPTNIK